MPSIEHNIYNLTSDFCKFISNIDVDNVLIEQRCNLYYDTIKSYLLSQGRSVKFFIPECIELFDFPSKLKKFYNLCPLKVRHEDLAKHITELYFEKAEIEYYLGTIITGIPKGFFERAINTAIENVEYYISNGSDYCDLCVLDGSKVRYINMAAIYFQAVVTNMPNAKVAIISDGDRDDNQFDKLTRCYIDLNAYGRALLLFKILKEILARNNLVRKCQLRQNADKTAWLLTYSEI